MSQSKGVKISMKHLFPLPPTPQSMEAAAHTAEALKHEHAAHVARGDMHSADKTKRKYNKVVKYLKQYPSDHGLTNLNHPGKMGLSLEYTPNEYITEIYRGPRRNPAVYLSHTASVPDGHGGFIPEIRQQDKFTGRSTKQQDHDEMMRKQAAEFKREKHITKETYKGNGQQYIKDFAAWRVEKGYAKKGGKK